MSLDDMEMKSLQEDAAAVRGVSDARLAEMERQERIAFLMLDVDLLDLPNKALAKVRALMKEILGENDHA